MTAAASSSLWMAFFRAVSLLGLIFGLLVLMPGAVREAAAAELIMFDDVGCPWCRKWDREVGEAYRRSEEGRRAPLRRVHISEASRSGAMLATAVTVTPTFVLVDRGAEVGRITGYPGAEFFWAMLEALIARLPKAPSEVGGRDASLGHPQILDRRAILRLIQSPAAHTQQAALP